jgi:hypothetical protein
VQAANFLQRRFRLLYPAWIAISLLLILALRHQPDPSRSHGVFDSDEAARRAVSALRAVDGPRYAGYEVASVAYARKDELGTQPRWIVLCDRSERSGLSQAVVVELSSDGRTLLRVRPAVAN